MRFIHHILKAAPLPRDYSFRACFTSTAFRLQGKTREQAFPWKVQIGFLAKMCLLLFTLPFRLRRDPKLQVILYNVGSTPDQRLYFYRKFQNPDLPDHAVRTVHNDRLAEPLYYTRLGRTQISRLFRAAWILWRGTFRSVWAPSRVNPHWKLRFANLLLQQVLFHQEGHDQLLYFCYEPETYLSALIASVIVPDYRPQVVASNSLLFRDNRYLFNPRLDFRLCSRIQVGETDIYRRLGWMQVRSVTLWDLEEAMLYDQVPATPPTYDIGIYSSGGWARTHDLWRAADMNILRRGGYLDNPMYLQLLVILDVVTTLKKERPGLRVAFYLHPHELRLLHKNDVRPPYLPILDANGIDYSLEGQNSILGIYGPRIGIAVSSTILFDRMHLGLRSFYYAGTAIKNGLIDVRYLGDYAQYGYTDAGELREKILGELEIGK